MNCVSWCMSMICASSPRIRNTWRTRPPARRRPQNPAELIRYLDHCSDLLALLSKVAALYVQDFDDPVTLSAVNEIENLTNGISRKIWQKIMIFDRILTPAGAGAEKN